MFHLFLKRYISGISPRSALDRAKVFCCSNIGVSINLLGEHVDRKEQVSKYVRGYMQLIGLLKQEDLNVTVSIKLTMLGLSIDKPYCINNVNVIIKEASQLGIFIRIDMEETRYTQDTLDIFFIMNNRYPKCVGIVLQAMLFRTKKDIDRIIEHDGDVRLCKGAYKEPPNLAHQNMSDIRKSYKEYAQRLINHCSLTRFATHDDELINWVCDYVKENKIAYYKFEFQMILGFREPSIRALAQSGYVTRVYIPYGKDWYAYFYRRLKERKENVSFVIKHLFKH